MEEKEIEHIRGLVNEIVRMFPLRTFYDRQYEIARQHLTEAMFWIESTQRK